MEINGYKKVRGQKKSYHRKQGKFLKKVLGFILIEVTKISYTNDKYSHVNYA